MSCPRNGGQVNRIALDPETCPAPDAADGGFPARHAERVYSEIMLKQRDTAGRQFEENSSCLAAMSALVGGFAGGNLLDQFDDTAAELRVGDAREGTGQGQALGRCEEIGNISR